LQILKQANEDSKNIHGTNQPTKNFIRHLKSEPTQNKSSVPLLSIVVEDFLKRYAQVNKSMLVKLNATLPIFVNGSRFKSTGLAFNAVLSSN